MARRMLLVLCALAVVASGCAGVLANTPKWTKTQCWVEKGTMFAVGSWPNTHDLTLRSSAAEADARAALVMCRQGKIEIRTAPGEITVTQSAAGSIAGVQIVDRWVDDDGTEYALAAAPAQEAGSGE